MSNIVLKVTNSNDGFLRRLAFSSAPTWVELAGKLESIYGIHKNDLCVSYIDIDGDEIVLNSSAELDELFQLHAGDDSGQTHENVKVIRFTVQSLNNIRHHQTSDGIEIPNSARTATTDVTAGDVTIPIGTPDDIVRASSPDDEEEGNMHTLIDAQSEISESDTISTVESVNAVGFARFASPPIGDPIFAPGEFVPPPFVHGRRGGRGRAGHRGHPYVRGHHDPRSYMHFPPFPPTLRPSFNPTTTSTPSPSYPSPFTVFGSGRGGHRGRGGISPRGRGRGHMYGGHAHPFEPFGAHAPPFPPTQAHSD